MRTGVTWEQHLHALEYEYGRAAEALKAAMKLCRDAAGLLQQAEAQKEEIKRRMCFLDVEMCKAREGIIARRTEP